MISPVQPLFSPLTQRSITFRNRIGISPMCMYSYTDGFANDFLLAHLGARALGGAGIVFTEATAVEPRGRISPRDLGLWKDEHIAPLARVTKLIREHGAAPGIQLAHAGWKAGTPAPWQEPEHRGDWVARGVSAVAFDTLRVPEEIADPGEIVDLFRDAAGRALAAGFEVCELHGAHGYLLHSFLSPISNRRRDGYGGSFENRTRLFREVAGAVRDVWPDRLPLWARFSCTDYLENGWTLDDSVELARQLKRLGVDCIDCSSGGIVPRVKIETGPGYQVAFAERIRREANIATAAVGMITSPLQANDIIAAGRADFTLLARESLRDPHFPLRAAKELAAAPPAPVQYARAF